MTPLLDTPVVMLTHRLDAAILGHYARLKREVGGVLPVYLAYHSETAETPAGVDIHIRDADLARALPTRHEQRTALQHRFGGYTDTALFAIADAPVLPNYRHIWIIEYDVDFAGHWLDFFSRYFQCDTDVVANNIRSKGETESWDHWVYGRARADIPETSRYRLYSQLIRMSQRFLRTYRWETARPGWRGHYEQIFATAAFVNGLSMEDMGGEGAFAAPEGRRWYDTTTFRFRPVRSTAYYHQNPANFVPGWLHHPVKVPDEAAAAAAAAEDRPVGEAKPA